MRLEADGGRCSTSRALVPCVDVMQDGGLARVVQAQKQDSSRQFSNADPLGHGAEAVHDQEEAALLDLHCSTIFRLPAAIRRGGREMGE